MTTREIQGHLEEMYGVEVSPTLISNVTDAVIEEVKHWQNRPLDELYPIVYLDALMVKVRDEGPRAEQGDLCGDGRQPGGAEGSAGAVGGAERRSQVLAAGADGAEEPRGEGHLHRLRGWAERISGSDRGGVPADRGAVVHRASGAGLAELRALESAQGGGRRTCSRSTVQPPRPRPSSSSQDSRASGKPIPV